ncbi:MBL fold metallo-hydrolase [Actinoplanes subtropicus]|uniref:MBL fold metallo-hydrolase n=1 Tax=Actinoplanes subtropicus TaxID=543632 RepID=UPI00054F1C4E|nr:MBL fold metallo-hydrolase [Actinoplanes subtropicus]
MIVTGEAQHRAWQQRVLPPVEQVRPGVWSIPVPIPHNPLRYTLAYAFLDDPAVLLVDPGWESDESREALTAGLRLAGAAVADVTGVLVTHVHFDHHGLSGWVRERSGAWIGMHPAEARALPGRTWHDGAAAADHAWLLRHGVPAGEAAILVVDPAKVGDILEMVEPDRTFEDGDLLPTARHELRAVWTPGHTPGHLCLHDAAAGLLLTGDHLLPRITPNIGVHDDEDDPLSDYLASLERTAKFTAEEALPAHEYRFRGIDARAADLIAHHDERGHEILTVLDRLGPSTGWAIAAELTWSRGWDALRGMLRRMALAETLAHLHYLAGTGAVRPDGGTPERWRR